MQWVFGVPVIVSQREKEKFQFGSSAISAIDEEVYTYPSPLFFDQADTKKSVLSMIWSQRKRWDHGCLYFIQQFLKLILSSPRSHCYINSLPAPTYQYSNYIQWVQDYTNNSALYTVSSVKKNSLYTEDLLLLSKIPGLPQCFQYVIGKTLDESMVEMSEKENVLLSLTQFRTKWGNSLPNGKVNLAVPNLTFYIDSKRPNDNKNSDINSNTDLKSTQTLMEDLEISEENNGLIEDSECVIRFEIVNNQTEAVRVELEFTRLDGNFFCPCAPITVQVQPMQHHYFINLVKKIPQEPWGNIEYQWKLEKPKISEIKDTTENILENLDIFGIEDIGMNVSDFEDEITPPTGKVSCPRCTFFNDTIDTKCYMCNFVFTKR